MGDIRLYDERETLMKEEKEGGKRIEGCCWRAGEKEEEEELPCPAVYPSLPLAFQPCSSTIPLTSCEFKQLSFCEVIPNALK